MNYLKPEYEIPFFVRWCKFYGKRQHEYFLNLCNMKKEQNETYRGLMAKIVQNLDRCVKE